MKQRLLSMMFVAVCAMFSSLTASAQEPYAVLSSDNKVLTFYYDYNKASRGGMSVGPFTYDSSKDTVNSGWFNNRSKIQTVVFDDSFANCTSITSTACWFFEMFYLQTITGLKNLNTENVTDMSHMFESAQMKELDVSHFNTSKVTDMTRMFCYNDFLETLDLRSFNTENVTSMHEMFEACTHLRSIDLSSFNTQNVTDMSEMFCNCSNLESLDLSNFNTEHVTDMSYMFDVCKKLTSLDLSSFNTSNVTDMSGMFMDCVELESLNVSSFNTEKVKKMYYMFAYTGKLTKLDLRSFNTKNVEDMSYMFKSNNTLKTIYVDEELWSTEKVVNSEAMFYGCTSLVGGNGTSYSESFVDHTYARVDKPGQPGYLTKVEPYGVVSGNNTVLTLYYDGYRYSRNGLLLNLPFRFNSDVPWWSAHFSIQKVIIDESIADFTDVTSMAYWFNGLSEAKEITGLDYLNTSNVTDMRSMFSGCNWLKSLDLSNFNTANVTNMDGMFFDCRYLETIYADEKKWSTAKVTSGNQMFQACENLAGGNGTRYHNVMVDNYSYARIDKAGQPGYLTDKNLPAGIDTPISDVTDVVNDKWYTLDGRKLDGAPTTKGVYINKGVKVVIK